MSASARRVPKSSHAPGQWARVVQVVVATLVVGACATAPRTERADPQGDATDPPSPPLAVFDQWLGRYASPTEDPLQLAITAQDASDNERVFVWTQHPVDEAADARRFVIRVAAVGDRLESTFAPLSADAQGATRCPLRWQIARGDNGQPSLLGRTDASTCQFGPDQAPTSLIKEIAFDGQRIRVADRLVPSTDTETPPPPQITEFIATTRYTGTVGVLDGDAWRVSEPMALTTDGRRRALRDAAGMPIGLAVALDRVYLGDGLRLRLVVSNADSDRVVGQAWADSDTQAIGWTSPEIQAAFRRGAEKPASGIDTRR